ncbi:MAG: pyruvate kinase [Candidatus Komeilibacteria bacterium]|nr:pyruvate kinase [Candidatus Komeilibacteria bacterium]
MHIIATIWKKPYYHDRNQRMIEAGVDVFRVKCGHIPADEVAVCLNEARKQINENGGRVKLLADLPEAKLRIGEYPQERVRVQKNQEFRFLHGPLSSDPEAYIPFRHEELGKMVHVGDRLLVNDGKLMFEVTTKHSDREFIAKTLNEGDLVQRSAIMLPRVMDELDHIVPEIDEMLAILPQSKPEMVAFSFVKSSQMLETLISKLEKHLTPDWRPMIIAKIESQEGVDNIDEILNVCHGIMVARGDMALTIPFEKLGLIQKKLVAKARARYKYSIVATGILGSLLDNYIPARSDILDVTNACLDGASAIMLCPETAHSETPERAVQVARAIIDEVEGF